MAQNIILKDSVTQSQVNNIILKDPVTGETLVPQGTSVSTNGKENIAANAKMICDVISKTTAKLVAQTTYNANTSIEGVVYSSTRYEDLLVPNNVSMWTYLSSMTDPQSYLYTRNVKTDYGLGGLANAYYGQVCSSFVQWCLGIKENFQIYQMHYWDGFSLKESQDATNLEVGDILLSLSAAHTKICIDVDGNDFIIAEGVPNTCEYAKYSISTINGWIANNGYKIYQYSDVDYVPKQVVGYADKNGEYYDFNWNIMPRRGDKANWRKDENVIIDILDLGNYTSYQLYKNGTLQSTTAISSGSTDINLGILPYGKYKMRLTDGTNYSGYVYWIVANYSESAQKVTPSSSPKAVRIDFASANATPVWITWRRPQSASSTGNNMPVWTTKITPTDVTNGYVISEPPSHFFSYGDYNMSTWEYKVAYETEYGIISSDSMALSW